MNEKNNGLVGGLFWSFIERFGSQAVSMVVSIVLARIIAPADYGIIAAVTIFTSVATAFVTGGFGNALIQKKDAKNIDYSSMFFFNIAFSIVLYIIVFFSAPFLVKVLNKSYDYTLLVKVLRVLGLGVVFASFNSFYRSVLSKKLQFKKIFIVTLSGTVFSALVGLIMAYTGSGLWALVAQNLTQYIVNAIFFLLISKYKPEFAISFARLKPMIVFGGKLMLSSLLSTIYVDISSLVIGNKYTSQDLAYYNKGISFPKMMVVNILSAINTVLFPVMTKFNSDDEYKEFVKKFNKTSTYIIAPLMFGLAAVSNTFISLLLTDKWLPCVVFLQISCLDYAIQPLGIANLQFWKASGRATLYLVTDILKKVVGIGLITVAVWLKRGIVPISLATLLATVFASVISMIPGKKYMNYSIWEQIKDVVPQFVLSFVMYITVMLIGCLSFIPNILLLSVQVIVGGIVYLAGSKLLKIDELDQLFIYAKRLKK